MQQRSDGLKFKNRVLGWNQSSLAMLTASELTDQLNPLPAATATVACTYGGNYPCFLWSVWMSGYGIAADPTGNLFFTTGNTCSGSFDPKLNISESANTATIWALGRPIGNDNLITLYAFDGTASGTAPQEIWHDDAGSWPNLQGNANLVPTLANGRVYVASFKQLAIFGLRSPGRQKRVREPRKILVQPLPHNPNLTGRVSGERSKASMVTKSPSCCAPVKSSGSI